MGDIVLPELNL